MANTVIGLDIGHRSVKAAILSTTLRGFELVGMGEIPFEDASRDPNPEELQAALQEVVQKAGGPFSAITSISGESASYRSMNMPFSDLRQVERALPFALEEEVPYSLDTHIWDAQQMEVREDGSSVMLTALAPHDRVAAQLAHLKESGIDPRIIITPPLALGNLYRQVLEADDGLELVVDIGHKLTHMVGLRDGEIVSMRSIIWGGRNVTEHLARNFELSFDKAEQGKHDEAFLQVGDLVADGDEQRRICEATEAAIEPLIAELRYTTGLMSSQAGTAVRKIRLTGGGSRLRYLDLYLWSILDIPTEHLSLLREDFNRLPDGFTDEDKLAVSLGLGTYGLGHKGKLINLRKNDLAYAGEFLYYKGQIAQVVIGLIAIMLFAFINVGTDFWALGHQEDQLKDRMSQVTKKVIGKSISNPKRALAIMTETIGGKIGDEDLPIPEVSGTTLIAEVANRLQTASIDARLTELSFKVLRNNISMKIKGNADSIPTVGKIEETLSRYRCFKRINPGSTRQSVGGTRIEFSFEMVVSCEGAPEEEEATEAAEETPAESGPESPAVPQPETRKAMPNRPVPMVKPGVPADTLKAPPPTTNLPGTQPSQQIKIDTDDIVVPGGGTLQLAPVQTRKKAK